MKKKRQKYYSIRKRFWNSYVSFALGLILFECIFKKLPFGESYDEEQMLKFIDKGINFNALKGIFISLFINSK